MAIRRRYDFVGFSETIFESTTVSKFSTLICRKPNSGNFLKMRDNWSKSAGFDPDYYFIEDFAGDVPYYFYSKDAADHEKFDLCRRRFFASANQEISEVSAAVRGLQKGFQIHRVCFPPELKDEMAKTLSSKKVKKVN